MSGVQAIATGIAESWFSADEATSPLHELCTKEEDRGKLKETFGKLENTLIIFLSDNGACYEWGPFGFDGPSRRAGATRSSSAGWARRGQAAPSRGAISSVNVARR